MTDLRRVWWSCSLASVAAALAFFSSPATASPHPLSVSVAGQGVVASPAIGVHCAPACSASIAAGTLVTLAARPAPGHVLSGWSGACTGTDTCTLRMDGTRSVSATFVPIPGWKRTVAIAAARGHRSFAVTAQGELWGAGWNYQGAVGDGSGATSIEAAVPLGSAAGWTSVSGGFHHSVALKSDGTLWTWGSNGSAQLGDAGAGAQRLAPGQVGAETSWKAVSAGSFHTLALRSNGTLWAWGTHANGQLGIGPPFGAGSSAPAQVGSDTNWASIAAGDDHSLAIKSDGTLWAWGYNPSGQLGNGTSNNAAASPLQVGSDTDWVLASAGAAHTLALKRNGTLWAWGSNASGQLGDGTGIQRLMPVQVGSANDWRAVAAGASHTIALKTDGSLWAWGDNPSGQLGDGSTAQRNAPVRIGTASDWVAISAGSIHTLALRSDGTVWGWGSNGFGQLSVTGAGNATAPTEFTPTVESSKFLPLVDNATWQYDQDGTVYTRKVLGGTATVNGAPVKRIQDQDDLYETYYTSDASGVREHGSFEPSVFVEGFGTTSALSSLNPPFRYAEPRGALGRTVTSGGTYTINYAGFGSFNLTYTGNATPIAFETVTVGSTQFRAIRVDLSAQISGSIGGEPVNISQQTSQWAVEGLGVVKDVSTIDDGSGPDTSTEVLVASSLSDTTPDSLTVLSALNVPPGVPVISHPVTVSGVNAGVAVGVTGGEYSVDGAAWTSSVGTVFEGQTVRVRVNASPTLGGTANATLSIGGQNAVFAATTTTGNALTVSVSGSGSVSSAPSAIACGATCSANFAPGQLVTLTPAPAAGHQFLQWGGACSGAGACSVSMDVAESVSATFVPVTVPLSVVRSGGGTVVSSPPGINCGVTCATFLATGTSVTLTPLPAGGELFVGWAGSCSGSGACVVSVTQATQVSAYFTGPVESAYSAVMRSGFNLSGNSLDVPLDPFVTFGNVVENDVAGVSANVDAIWRWNATTQNWQFYTPQLSVAQSNAYATANGFEPLTSIPPGAGFWVNAYGPLILPAIVGGLYLYGEPEYSALPRFWNLLSSGVGETPSEFNDAVGTQPENFESLWAWDATQLKWYFYSPQLDSGVPLTNAQYATQNGFLDFTATGRMLDPGTGFWVYRP